MCYHPLTCECVDAATVTVAMGVAAAGIVGVNMFLLSDKLCQAFTRDPQVVQVPLLPICTVFFLHVCRVGSSSHSTSLKRYCLMVWPYMLQCPNLFRVKAVLVRHLWKCVLLSVLQTVSRLAPLLAFYSIMNGSGFLLAGALK